MKDWRGVTLSVGDQVVWVSHSGHFWTPRVGSVSKVNEQTGHVTVKRDMTQGRVYSWERGTSTLPASRLTRVDQLPAASDAPATE